MQGTALKEKLRRGEFCRGVWVSLPSVPVVDTLGHAGFDFVLFDSEHAPITPYDLETLTTVLRQSSAVPIVRVGWNDMVEIKRVLDAGAEGVLVPMVNTAEEARRAVAAAKYPPQGVRGVAPRAASEFGRKAAEYLATANDRVVVMTQIEHIDAVRNLDALLGVEGIDCLMVGPADLSASMGYLGRIDHPEVQSAIDDVIRRATAAGVPVATVSTGAEQARALAGRGFQVLTLGSDLALMRAAALDVLTRVPPDSFKRAGAG